jgi:hypothetical protein
MRRPSSLVCLRAAVLGIPILVACGTSAPPDFGNGPSDSGSITTSVHVSTGVSTFTTTSTIHLADGGVSTSTGVVTSSFTQTSTSTGSASGSTNTSGGTSTSASGDAGADAGSARMCTVASAQVVADFEDAKPLMVASNGFTGAWSANDSLKTGVKQVAMTTEASPPGPSCNKYSIHATIPGPIASGGYGQLRGDFLADNQGVTTGSSPEPYPLPEDISMYQGVKFDISTGSGTTKFPIAFEMLGQESTPVTDPNSNNPVGGLAMTKQVDQYNNRGWMITSLSSGWQTITVPFSLLVPHWLPSPGSSGCGTSGPCVAPLFVPAHALGLQFATNPDQAANGSLDIWVDNVTLVADASAGLVPPGMTMPTWPHDGMVGSCTKPTGASGKLLLWAYYNWKNTFVKGNAGSSRYVYSPEINGGSVVSEGIGYGLLLAVFFNDQSLFNDLWSFWSAHTNGTTLMQWRWNNNGSSNTGSGSASDADEDAAFALIEAGKKWGGSYAGTASNVISDIWNHDMDQTAVLPLGGNQGYTASSVKNPSYFAPAYYRIFATVDTAHSSQWNTAATNVYSALSKLLSNVSSKGLVSAWVNSGFTGTGSNGASTDVDYQYDSHRIPWRVGLDYCWNGTSSAKAFLDANSGFFNGVAGTNGIGRVLDVYDTSGNAGSNAAPNSLSIVGTSGVGAMHSSTYSAYANQAWQLVLDGLNRASLDVNSGQTSGYSYYNATIGLMTALSMSGNFYPM